MHSDDELNDPVLAQAVSELRDHPPASDLWPAIAPQLTLRRPKGTILLRWPAALAAGVAIALLSSGGSILLMHRITGNPTAPATGAASTFPVAWSPADSTLARAIQEVERSLRVTMAQLDAPARDGINRSLDVLDQAIADAAARRAAAPEDARAERYLTATLRKKLDVLRSVSTLTALRS